MFDVSELCHKEIDIRLLHEKYKFVKGFKLFKQNKYIFFLLINNFVFHIEKK